MTKFDGHILEGAILQKTSSSNGFEVKLLPGGSLIEYWPGKPEDHWSGEWTLHDNGNLVIQVGQYRSIYYPAGTYRRNGYLGEEDGEKMEIYFLKDGDSWLDRLGDLFSSGASSTFSSSSGDWRAKAAREADRLQAPARQAQEREAREKREQAARKESAYQERKQRLQQADTERLLKWQEEYRCHICRHLHAEPETSLYVWETTGGQYNWSEGGSSSYVKWPNPEPTNVMVCAKSGWFFKHWVCMSEDCQQNGICRNCAKKL